MGYAAACSLFWGGSYVSLVAELWIIVYVYEKMDVENTYIKLRSKSCYFSGRRG